MSSPIFESGMNFIVDNTFRIEKSPLYTQLGENVKSVEFIRVKENKLLFVEAKSSFPNPSNPIPNPNKGNKIGSELFREEIADICDKFFHSLNLYATVDVGVTEGGFPEGYAPPVKVSLVFVLVINGFEKSWCDEVERALLNKLRESICMTRIWKPKVHVMNYETAIKKEIAFT